MLDWAVKQLCETAPQWAKDVLPVYRALGLGLNATLGEGNEVVEGPVPTEKELTDWAIKLARSFKENPMRQLMETDPQRFKERVSFQAHHAEFWISDNGKEGAGCGIQLVLVSISISGHP